MKWDPVKNLLLGWAATYGALWVVIEPIAYFTSLEPKGWGWYIALLVVSVIGGIWRVLPTRRVAFTIPGSDSSFEIKFGDLFAGKGVFVIPVNEFFDGKLGDHVSRKSIHGQFIEKLLGGQSKRFVDLTRKALEDSAPDEIVVDRSSGERNRYAIGTVARITMNNNRYLLAALSHTELESLKAYASVNDLWTCLAGVWNGIRVHSSGERVQLPLLGSGLSGVGLPASRLVEIMLTSFLCHTKERKVAERVTLVLPRRLAGKVDLNRIKRSWEQ